MRKSFFEALFERSISTCLLWKRFFIFFLTSFCILLVLPFVCDVLFERIGFAFNLKGLYGWKLYLALFSSSIFDIFILQRIINDGYIFRLGSLVVNILRSIFVIYSVRRIQSFSFEILLLFSIPFFCWMDLTSFLYILECGHRFTQKSKCFVSTISSYSIRIFLKTVPCALMCFGCLFVLEWFQRSHFLSVISSTTAVVEVYFRSILYVFASMTLYIIGNAIIFHQIDLHKLSRAWNISPVELFLNLLQSIDMSGAESVRETNNWAYKNPLNGLLCQYQDVWGSYIRSLIGKQGNSSPSFISSLRGSWTPTSLVSTLILEDFIQVIKYSSVSDRHTSVVDSAKSDKMAPSTSSSTSYSALSTSSVTSNVVYFPGINREPSWSIGSALAFQAVCEMDNLSLETFMMEYYVQHVLLPSTKESNNNATSFPSIQFSQPGLPAIVSQASLLCRDFQSASASLTCPGVIPLSAFHTAHWFTFTTLSSLFHSFCASSSSMPWLEMEDLFYQSSVTIWGFLNSKIGQKASLGPQKSVSDWEFHPWNVSQWQWMEERGKRLLNWMELLTDLVVDEGSMRSLNRLAASTTSLNQYLSPLNSDSKSNNNLNNNLNNYNNSPSPSHQWSNSNIGFSSLNLVSLLVSSLLTLELALECRSQWQNRLRQGLKKGHISSEMQWMSSLILQSLAMTASSTTCSPSSSKENKKRPKKMSLVSYVKSIFEQSNCFSCEEEMEEGPELLLRAIHRIWHRLERSCHVSVLERLQLSSSVLQTRLQWKIAQMEVKK